MSIVQHPADFVTWFFGPAFKAELDAIDAAREAEAAEVNLRDSWPAWTDAETWGLGPDAGPEPGPEPAPFAPGRRDEAAKLGFDLGLEREDASPPAHFTPEEAGDFEAGWAAGRAEWDRRLEVMCGDPEYAEFSGRVSERDVYSAGGMS